MNQEENRTTQKWHGKSRYGTDAPGIGLGSNLCTSWDDTKCRNCLNKKMAQHLENPGVFRRVFPSGLPSTPLISHLNITHWWPMQKRNKPLPARCSRYSGSLRPGQSLGGRRRSKAPKHMPEWVDGKLVWAQIPSICHCEVCRLRNLTSSIMLKAPLSRIRNSAKDHGL